MFADDDEAEESTAGITRYPIMPSLVGLQQMRVRLHMANLGRKLMKWTSVATAAEQRRLSEELQKVYKTFGVDMKEAFVLLARCRYFFPDLNKVIVEDVQRKATIRVESHNKTVSGVRMLQYGIVETDKSYRFLGLGKGGEAIEDARLHWIKLLKLQILMVQLRNAFMLVEAANKTATKRLNVINKVVIPRTKATTKYILVELEEMEREELHRIKKIQQKKAQKSEKKDDKGVCSTIHEVADIESHVMEPEPIVAKTESETKTVTVKTPSLTTPTPYVPEPTPQITEELHKIKEIQQKTAEKSDEKRDDKGVCCIRHEVADIESHVKEPEPIVAKTASETKTVTVKTPSLTTPTPCVPKPTPQITERSYMNKPSELIAVHEPVIETKYESKKDLYKPVCCRDVPSKTAVSLPPHLSLGDYSQDTTVQNLRKMLNDAITLGQDLTKSSALNMDEFLSLCKTAQVKLDEYANKEIDQKPDSNLRIHLQHLKCHIREVIDVTRDLRNITYLSPSVENFVQYCEQADEKLNIAIKNVATRELDDKSKTDFIKLREEIDDVLKLIRAYKDEGLLTESVENFSKVCVYTKSKIDCYTKEQATGPTEEKIDHLKRHIDNLEKITTDIKRDGVRAASIENFLSSCKDFKNKLEANKKPKHQGKEQVEKLLQQINAAIQSSHEAKKGGLVTDSVENFIKSCELFKTRLESLKDDKDSEQNKPLEQLKSDIEGIKQLIGNLEAQELISTSMAGLLLSAEDQNKNTDLLLNVEDQTTNFEFECSELCTCQPDDEEELCERCKEMYDEENNQDIVQLPAPCNTCSGIANDQLVGAEAFVKEIPCDSCGVDLEETDCKECPSGAEETLGLFEKKVRTITKIKRFRTETGDIREEKEVTTIKKMRHDPNETDIDLEPSLSSLDVGMCLISKQNLGYRKSKSEQMLRVSSQASPRLKQSISFNPQVFIVRNPSQILFLADTEETLSTTSMFIHPNFFS